MIELKCKNCSSQDMEYKDGMLTCNACGSRFVLESYERPQKSREDKLVKKISKLWKKKDKYNIDDPEKYLDCVEGIRECVSELLEINPENYFAWSIKFFSRIEDGLKTDYDYLCLLEYIENALKYSAPEDRAGVIGALKLNFEFYGGRIKDNCPYLRDRVDVVARELGIGKL